MFLFRLASVSLTYGSVNQTHIDFQWRTSLQSNPSFQQIALTPKWRTKAGHKLWENLPMRRKTKYKHVLNESFNYKILFCFFSVTYETSWSRINYWTSITCTSLWIISNKNSYKKLWRCCYTFSYVRIQKRFWWKFLAYWRITPTAICC